MRTDRTHQQGIAIRRGFGDNVATGVATGSGSIFNHNGAIKFFTKLRGHHTGQNIGGARRRKGHDN